MHLKKTLLGEDDIARCLKRISHEILEKNHGIENIVLAGVLTRGYPLAVRLAAIIEGIEGEKPEVAELDISNYRDDIDCRDIAKKSSSDKPDVDIENRTVIIVDDVLFTGRTIRAAMDMLMDMARPKRIQLAVLVDRGHRELPIRPDFVGKNLPTGSDETVEVTLIEIDGEDSVSIIAK